MFGSLARLFNPHLKPLVTAARKIILWAGTTFVLDVIDGKSIDDVAVKGVKCLVTTNKKKWHGEQSIIPKKRQKGKQGSFS